MCALVCDRCLSLSWCHVMSIFHVLPQNKGRPEQMFEQQWLKWFLENIHAAAWQTFMLVCFWFDVGRYFLRRFHEGVDAKLWAQGQHWLFFEPSLTHNRAHVRQYIQTCATLQFVVYQNGNVVQDETFDLHIAGWHQNGFLVAIPKISKWTTKVQLQFLILYFSLNTIFNLYFLFVFWGNCN